MALGGGGRGGAIFFLGSEEGLRGALEGTAEPFCTWLAEALAMTDGGGGAGLTGAFRAFNDNVFCAIG